MVNYLLIHGSGITATTITIDKAPETPNGFFFFDSLIVAYLYNCWYTKWPFTY
jgi:hypothetical protein